MTASVPARWCPNSEPVPIFFGARCLSVAQAQLIGRGEINAFVRGLALRHATLNGRLRRTLAR